jgi:hypothetical protein
VVPIVTVDGAGVEHPPAQDVIVKVFVEVISDVTTLAELKINVDDDTVTVAPAGQVVVVV